LGEGVAEVVEASLVNGLELFKDIGRLRVPLKLGLFYVLNGIGYRRRFGL